MLNETNFEAHTTNDCYFQFLKMQKVHIVKFCFMTWAVTGLL